MRAYDSDLKIYEKRCKETSTEKGRTNRKYFVELFMQAGVKHGKRKSEDQSAFKKSLIKDYGAAHPTSRGLLWCSLSGIYCNQDFVIAAHIFPSTIGQTTMTAIFQTESELYSSRNGVLMRADLEKRFDKYWIAIVPFADYSSAKEAKDWSTSDPQRWMIQVMNPKPTQMQDALDWAPEKTYLDLDG